MNEQYDGLNICNFTKSSDKLPLQCRRRSPHQPFSWQQAFFAEKFHNRGLAKLSIIKFQSAKRENSSGLKKIMNYESEFIFCPKRVILDTVEANALNVYSEHN